MSKWRDLRYEIEEYEEDHYNDSVNSEVEEQNLMLTCIREVRVAQFRKIISRGVDPNFCNRYGETPLHVASILPPCPDVLEMMQLLVFFGGPVERRDRYGLIPLHNACQVSADYVRMLLDAGSQVNCQDNAGRTPLMLTCSSNSPEALTIVQYLLDRGANVCLRDEDGQTALHYICCNKQGQDVAVRNEIVYRLLYAGIPVNMEDNKSHTAMCDELVVSVLNNNQHTSTDVSQRLQVFKTLLRGGGKIRLRECDVVTVVLPKLNSHLETCVTLYRIAEPVIDLSLRKKLLWFCILASKQSGNGGVNNRRFYDLVKKSSETVGSLKSTCRTVVRGELRGGVFVNVDKLNIPRYLEDYITFSECV